MKNYQKPEMEVVIFSVEDIITLSAGDSVKTVDAGNAAEIGFSDSQKEGIRFQ